MERTVVCFGDSITRGLISTNYVKMLEERLSGDGYRFINAGVNNDHTYNLIRRMGPVVELQPDRLVMMIGTNDVISSLMWHVAMFNIVRKRLPQRPTLDQALLNVTRLVRMFKAGTKAKIGLASIPVLGEDLLSIPMKRVQTYNAGLQRIAAMEKVTYLPVYESQEAYLLSHGNDTGRPYTGSIPLMLELMVRRVLLREPFESFSARKGYALVTDGVHMNRVAATLIADVVEEFLRG